MNPRTIEVTQPRCRLPARFAPIVPVIEAISSIKRSDNRLILNLNEIIHEYSLHVKLKNTQENSEFQRKLCYIYSLQSEGEG